MYPSPYGWRVHLELLRVDDTVTVRVHAPMYVNKVYDLPVTYSSAFSDLQILRDHTLLQALHDRYRD